MKKAAVPRAEDKKGVVLRALLEEPEGGLEESASETVKSLAKEDEDIALCLTTRVEFISALAR